MLILTLLVYTQISEVSSYTVFSGFSGSDGRGILPRQRLQQGAHVSQDKQPLQMNCINFTGKTPHCILVQPVTVKQTEILHAKQAFVSESV